MRRDGDGLLTQERQRLQPSRRCHRTAVDGDIGVAADGFGQGKCRGTDEPDALGEILRGRFQPLLLGLDDRVGCDLRIEGRMGADGDLRTDPGCGKKDTDKVGQRPVRAEADRDREGAVAEDIALDLKPGDVFGNAELADPGRLVRSGGGNQGGVVCRVDGLAGGVEERLDVRRQRDLARGHPQRTWRPRAEMGEVVGPAGLGRRTDRGSLPTAEGLALDDGAGDAAVDVEVARLDRVDPGVDFIGIERVDPCGEAVVGRVLELDRLVEIGGVHDAEHRAEELGRVEMAAGHDAGTDTG